MPRWLKTFATRPAPLWIAGLFAGAAFGTVFGGLVAPIAVGAHECVLTFGLIGVVTGLILDLCQR